MIPYMVELDLILTHFNRGLVKNVPGRGYFRAVPSQNGDKCVTSLPPSDVERLAGGPIPNNLRRRAAESPAKENDLPHRVRA